MPLTSVLSFEAASRNTYYVVQAYRSQVWDLDHYFSRWFSNPITFRHLLKTCNGVVSGSQALQFFDRTQYPESDMDIFLPLDGVKELGFWLQHDMGYRYSESKFRYSYFENTINTIEDSHDGIIQPDHGTPGILSVIELIRHDRQSSGSYIPRRIQLVVLNTNPTSFIVFKFHSSEFPNPVHVISVDVL